MLNLLSSLALTVSAASSPTFTVDLDRYAGVWYEIASKPQVFQQGCTCTQAEYGVDYNIREADAPTLRVTNTCWRNGEKSEIKGIARIVDPASNAQLMVQFPNSPAGQYNIVALDPDYRFAVVKGGSETSLWILARERQPSAELIGEAVKAASEQAKLTGLWFTEQANCPNLPQ